MTRTKFILSVAAMLSLVPCLQVYPQGPAGPGVGASASRVELIEAEFEVKMREVELKMAELGVEEATVELNKSELRLQSAADQGDSRELAYAKLDVKEAEIRMKMTRIRCEMVRLRIERGKAILAHIRATLNEKPEPSDTSSQF